MKTATYFLFLILSVIASVTVCAQQNPAALNPLINPTPLNDVGAEFDFSFSVGNNGSLPISGADANNIMRFDVTLGKSKPKTASGISIIGTDAVTGNVFDYFTITYNSTTNTFTGIQKPVQLPPLVMTQFSVHAVVTTLSSNSEAAQIGASVDVTPNVSSIGTQSEVDDDVQFFTYTLTILPVSSITLRAVSNGDKSTLEWQTIGEDNTAYFQIEKSVDGITFNAIGKTAAAGNINSVNRYKFVDLQFSKTSYYRIKLYDKDGKVSFSNIEALAKNLASGINLFPNPARSFVIVSGLREKQTIMLCDYKGAALQQIKVKANTNYINLEGYSAGTYIIRVLENGSVISTNKFIKN